MQVVLASREQWGLTFHLSSCGCSREHRRCRERHIPQPLAFQQWEQSRAFALQQQGNVRPSHYGETSVVPALHHPRAHTFITTGPGPKTIESQKREEGSRGWKTGTSNRVSRQKIVPQNTNLPQVGHRPMLHSSRLHHPFILEGNLFYMLPKPP